MSNKQASESNGYVDGFVTQMKEGQRFAFRMAKLMADDRLWINSKSGQCREFFAVELARSNDCGGRSPLVDAVDVYRAVLVNGTTGGFEDGVDRDDLEHSVDRFPFLAAPVGQGANR